MFTRSQISGRNQLKMFDNIAIPNPVTHFTHWEAFLPLGLLQIMNVLLNFHLKYKQFDLKIIWNYHCALELCCYHGGLEGRLEDKWIGSKSMCWKNLWRCWSMNCRTGIHQTQLHHPGNTGSRNSRTWIQRESPCRAWTDFCLCGVWFFFSEFFRNSWCNVPGSLDSQWAWP